MQNNFFFFRTKTVVRLSNQLLLRPLQNWKNVSQWLHGKQFNTLMGYKKSAEGDITQCGGFEKRTYLNSKL